MVIDHIPLHKDLADDAFSNRYAAIMCYLEKDIIVEWSTSKLNPVTLTYSKDNELIPQARNSNHNFQGIPTSSQFITYSDSFLYLIQQHPYTW